MDAWVYLAHGQVFATAQSGSIVLIGVALASGDVARAATRLPSLLAFVTGALASQLFRHLLKRNRLNSRKVRLGLVCITLVALGLCADCQTPPSLHASASSRA
jgi:uncharacterized membrane protein YoaK (UPF0700 family)